MDLFNMLRGRLLAWYIAGFFFVGFGFLWLLLIIPLFTGPSGTGDHNGIGLLLGVAIDAVISLRILTRLLNRFERINAANARAYRDQLRAEEDEWRRTHPF